MITLASHKTLLEKNIIKDLKPNKDGVEIEMFVSPSEEQKSPQSEFSLKKPNENSPQKKNPERPKTKTNGIDDIEFMEKIVNWNESIFLILMVLCLNFVYIAGVLVENRMQGLYDIYDTMNTYIENDIWDNNNSSIDCIANIEYLKIQPEYFYDNFLNGHMLEIIYNDENLTVEYDPFHNLLKNNNLTFIKSSNLLLGVQLIFTPTAMSSDELAAIVNLNDYMFNSLEDLENPKQINQSLPQIKDEWRNFIASTTMTQNGAITFLYPGIWNQTYAKSFGDDNKELLDLTYFVGQIELDIYFYNPNYEILVQLDYTYEKDYFDKVTYISYVQGGFPTKINANSKIGSDTKNFILASKIIYLLFVILGILIDVFHFVANILMRGETELDLTKLIPFISKIAVCVFISIWLMINTIYNAGIYPIISEGIQNFQDLNEMDFYIKIITAEKYLSIFSLISVVSLSFFLLHCLFPSFGMLFHTIINANTEIFRFLAVTSLFFICFVLWGHITIGFEVSAMSSFGTACLSLFDFMTSEGNFSTFMLVSTNEFKLVFLYFYAFVFNLLFLMFFIVIIMITYNELRPKMYLLTKALGEIKSQETKDHLLKWVDLIMMKIPPEFEEQDKKKGTKTVISSKLTTMDIFKHNLERLDIQFLKIFGIKSVNAQVLTKEQKFDKIMNQKQVIIEREKDRRTKFEAKINEKVWKNFKFGIIHVIFMIIYFTIVKYNWNGQNTRLFPKVFGPTFNVDSSEALGYNSLDSYANFSHISQVYNWLETKYFPNLRVLAAANLELTYNSPKNLTSALVIMNDPIIRITLRCMYPLDRNKYYYERDMNEMLQTMLDENELMDNFYGMSTGNFYHYIQPTSADNIETSYEQGGFSFFIYRNTSNSTGLFSFFQEDDIINAFSAMVIFDTIVIEPFSGVYGYTKDAINILSTGNIIINTHTMYYSLSLFDNYDSTRIFLEFLYISLNVYFWMRIMKHFYYEWEKLIEITPYDENFRKHRINYYLNLEVKSLCNGMEAAVAFKKVLSRGLLYLLRFMWMCYNYFAESYFNIIEFMSQMIISISIFSYLNILNSNFRTNYNSYDNKTLFNEAEKYAALNDSYILYESLNSFFIIIRIIASFYYSKNLTKFLNVLYYTKQAIAYFFGMYLAMLAAFAMFGFLILGEFFFSYKNLYLALLTNIRMVSGDLTLSQYLANDAITGTIYYLVFVVIMNLILRQMFIAIYDGSFDQENFSEKQEGILDSTYNFFKDNLEKTIQLHDLAEKKTKEKIDKTREKSLANYAKYRKSLEKKDYVATSYHISFYITYGLYFVFQYLLLIKDKISRTIEFYFYFTFFLKKQSELKEKVRAGGPSEGGVEVSKKERERDIPQGIDISFSKEKKRDLNEYNEAGFFVQAEPNIFLTIEDEVEKIKYDLIKPIIKDEREKNSTHIWFSALNGALTNFINNRVDFLLYEDPSFETYQNLNDKYIKKLNRDNTLEFDIKLKEYESCDHMEVRSVMREIINSMSSLFDQGMEKEHEAENEASFNKFNSSLDLLFYLYLNWAAQGRTFMDDVFGLEQLDKKECVFNKISNRGFTIPELEPYSEPLTVFHLKEKPIHELKVENKEKEENQEEEIKEPSNFRKKRRNAFRRSSLKLEKIDLNIQNIPYKEIEKFTDAEITETLSNFNMFQYYWKQVSVKQKMILWMENKNMTVLHRLFLWNQLDFTSKSFDIFGLDIALDHAVGFMNLNSNDKLKLDAQNELKVKIKNILQIERHVNNAALIQIWNAIYEYDDGKGPKKSQDVKKTKDDILIPSDRIILNKDKEDFNNDIISDENNSNINSNDFSIHKKNKNDHDALKYAPKRRINEFHLKLISNLVSEYGNKMYNIQNMNKIEKLAFLIKIQTQTHDEKMLLWLLTSPSERIKMIYEERESVVAEFMILLFIHEFYENILLIGKFESDLNQAFQNKIYSHYYSFSQFLSLVNAYDKFSKCNELDEKKKKYSEYISHLEKKIRIQETSLGILLEKYKKEKAALKELRKAKGKRNRIPITNSNSIIIPMKEKFAMAMNLWKDETNHNEDIIPEEKMIQNKNLNLEKGKQKEEMDENQENMLEFDDEHSPIMALEKKMEISRGEEFYFDHLEIQPQQKEIIEGSLDLENDDFGKPNKI